MLTLFRVAFCTLFFLAVTPCHAAPIPPPNLFSLDEGEVRIRATTFSGVGRNGRVLLAAESHTPVDGDTQTFRAPRRMTLTAAPDCYVSLGDTEATLSDLQPGYSVLIIGFESEGGKNIVARVVRIGAKSSLYVPPMRPEPTVTLPAANGSLPSVSPTPTLPGAKTTFTTEYDSVTRQAVTVPLTFPVAGRTSWSDTFLAPRSGGRRHHGQDLMTPKMTKLVACFDGTVRVSRNGLGGNALYVFGNNGWYAYYAHINNDTPGTNDGHAAANQIFAPGIKTGARVRAGQFLAFSGNSGNAESTAPHLHFELHKGSAVVNAAPSLARAQKLKTPRPGLPIIPELLPAPVQVASRTDFAPTPHSSEPFFERESKTPVPPVNAAMLEPTPAPIPPAPPAFAWQDNARRMVEVINFERRQRGLVELTAVDSLCFAAQAGSDAAASEVRVGRFRTGNAVPTAPLPSRLRAVKENSTATEVITIGSDDADKTAFVWFLRGGANRNALLSPVATRIGVAFTGSGRGGVWNVILCGD